MSILLFHSKYLKKGKNSIQIKFIAGKSSINRFDTYLYTLFVPDKASVAFPCFDQPDLKATFDLELSIPENWSAISNSKIIKETKKGNKLLVKFNKSSLISTYLFAFAAGDFKRLTKTKNGRTLNFYHREPDSVKVKANADTIFSFHFQQLIGWKNIQEFHFLSKNSISYVFLPFNLVEWSTWAQFFIGIPECFYQNQQRLKMFNEGHTLSAMKFRICGLAIWLP